MFHEPSHDHLSAPFPACSVDLFQFFRAAEPIFLQVAQAKALGIETMLVGAADTTRSGTLPARVLVPNEQMRIVSAPVAGMIEMLAVAPGAAVKRGQLSPRLASPQALELQRDALQAGSQAALLQQSLKRDEQLFAEGLIAESRLQNTRASAVQASGPQASERRPGTIAGRHRPGQAGRSAGVDSQPLMA
jgi:cobalt-zinc-cadmium efflux system membrane fusion protein